MARHSIVNVSVTFRKIGEVESFDVVRSLDEGAGTLDGTEVTDGTGGAAFDVALPADGEATGVTFSTFSGIIIRNATNEHERRSK